MPHDAGSVVGSRGPDRVRWRAVGQAICSGRDAAFGPRAGISFVGEENIP